MIVTIRDDDKKIVLLYCFARGLHDTQTFQCALWIMNILFL
jgi:hypothetical protein